MLTILNALVHGEDGLSLVEFSLFVGAMMMAGMGFLMFGASQLLNGFMGVNVWEMVEALPFAELLPFEVE